MNIGAVFAPFGPARGLMIKSFAEAVQEIRKQGYDISIRIENAMTTDQATADIDGSSLSWMEKEADCILVLAPSAYEMLHQLLGELKEKTKAPIIPLSPECASLGNIGPGELKIIWEYYKNGGRENIRHLLLFCSKLAGTILEEPGPPEESPQCGIYHPDFKHSFDSTGEYLKHYGKKGVKTIGILFSRTYWIENGLPVIDAVIREAEKNGLNVIPVFNNKFGYRGDDRSIEEFFFIEGEPVIDALFIDAYFFLRTVRERKSGDINHEEVDILRKLNVPALFIMSSMQSEDEWRSNPDGLTVPQLIIRVSMPEFDGITDPILVGTSEEEFDPVTGAVMHIPNPIDEQVQLVIKRIKKWISLREKENAEKKIAMVLLNSPCKSGVEATVGAGFGLDTLESAALLMKRLKDEGYTLDWVPRDGKELIDIIMEKKAISEFRWTSLDEIIKKGGAADFVELGSYRAWVDDLPPDAREKVFSSWGNPFDDEGLEPGSVEASSLALHNGRITVTGLRNGNLFIGIQPKRGCAGAECSGHVCKILHDPEIPPPHQYIAFYKWIERGFGADALLHVGTHGNIELLPGKRVALSASCYSEFLVGALPHLYIYVVSNPMEGSIAKRRGYAVIVDHLHPVMSDSGIYGALEDLEDPIEEYMRAESNDDKGRLKILESIIDEKSVNAGFTMNRDDFPRFKDFVEHLHGQMSMIRETMIRDGLHIFSRVPENGQLVDMLVSILRFDTEEVPSIRRCILEAVELDYDHVLKDPDTFNEKLGMTHGKALSLSIDTGKELVNKILAQDKLTDTLLEKTAASVIVENYKLDSFILAEKSLKQFQKTIEYGLNILPKIEQTTDETDNLIRGFHGEFIPPGASGALARGKIETLPTGRNFYSVDPWKIPTPAAWQVGIKLAEKFFHKYLHEHDNYPETIGFVFRFFDTFRADGELLSQILYTLGVRPKWDGSRVTGLDIIPLEELKRPRVDCTVQLSNMLRDGMPNAFELVDEAVQLVAFLHEPEDMNFIRKHTSERMNELGSTPGDDEARRLSTYRIFTAAPGVYDYGVNTAIAASAWEEDKDLSDIFIDTCGYAYGKGTFGSPAKDELTANLKRIEITYDKWDSDEYDILECCHIFGSGGGFAIAVKETSGHEVKSYFGDTHDPDRPQIRDMKEELERVARTRILNPKWIESKKRHGYKGAAVISDRVYHLYGWQATTKLVEDRVFDSIAETFVLDGEMKEWFQENNKWALESMTRRLLEAEQRNLWKPDPDILNDLKKAYLDIESWLEEDTDDFSGNIQGGNIDVVKIIRDKHSDE